MIDLSKLKIIRSCKINRNNFNLHFNIMDNVLLKQGHGEMVAIADVNDNKNITILIDNEASQLKLGKASNIITNIFSSNKFNMCGKYKYYYMGVENGEIKPINDNDNIIAFIEKLAK